MSDRNEILANFQACTGIDDVEVAILQLEESNWNLTDAVNKAIPAEPTVPERPPIVPGVLGVPAGATTSSSTSTPEESIATYSPFSSTGMGMSSGIPFNSVGISSFSSSGVASRPPLASLGQQPPVPIQQGLEPASPPILIDDSPTISSPFSRAGVTIADDFFAGPSSSYSQRSRMLEFNIQHNNRMIQLKVPDTEDLKTLKMLLQGETGFPPCQQDLRGFKVNVFPMSDHRKLNELNLPKENFLYLLTPTSPTAESAEDGSAAAGTSTSNGDPHIGDDDEEADFVLQITDESQNRDYSLNFKPTKTVLDIKIDVSMLTNIPVSKQVWRGWPESIADELSLAQIGISKKHKLYVKPKDDTSRNMPVLNASSSQGASAGATSSQGGASSRGLGIADSDEDDDDAADMMDDDDAIFLPEKSANNRRIQPLIPDDFGSDDTMAAIRFSEEFANRYGDPHPSFFPGSLDDAIRESCNQPASNRKMLAVYFHHDSSVLTNVFCTQALCADSVCSFLNENFINFGWDLTFSANKTRAVNMITKHFGSVAASTMKNMDMERLPLLVLIYKLRGSTEIFQMLHGNVTLDELMSRLLAAHEQYTAQLAVEVREEEERAARDAVKREQDLAFEMSLMADREKQAAKDKEESDRLAKEAEEKSQKEKADKIREARVRKLSARLPAEPKEEKAEGKPVSQLRFRIPATHTRESDETATDAASDNVTNGETKSEGKQSLERRFLASATLQTVIDYLTIEGFPAEEYKVLSSWPRRDLTTVDTSQSLKDLKLYPQETLMLEEKH